MKKLNPCSRKAETVRFLSFKGLRRHAQLYLPCLPLISRDGQADQLFSNFILTRLHER